MRFAILGSGAVGGYFGAKLAKAGQDVTFIARGAHLEAIRSKGLEVKSAKLGDFTVKAAAESDTARVGPVDVAIVSVKAYDNATALPMLGPLIGPDTVVLTLQNGVDSTDEVAAIAGERHVLQRVMCAAVLVHRPREAHIAFLVKVAPHIRERKIPLGPGGGKIRPDMIAKLLLADRERIEPRTVAARQRIEHCSGQVRS